MKAFDAMTLKDTSVWMSQCPPWCDGHPSFDTEKASHVSISSLMTPTVQGYVLARRSTRQLVPGIYFRYQVEGPVGYLRIEMNETETLAEFDKRANSLLDDYEKHVASWCEKSRPGADE